MIQYLRKDFGEMSGVDITTRIYYVKFWDTESTVIFIYDIHIHNNTY